MPQLEAVVEDIATVPESLQEYYVVQNGQHTLQLGGTDALPAVAGLKSAHEKTSASLKEAKSELKALGITTAELTDLRARADGKGNNQDFEVRLNEMKAGIEAKHTQASAEKDARIELVEAQLETHLVGSQLDAAIADAGVMVAYRPAVRAMLEQRSPSVQEDAGVFRGIFKTNPENPMIPGEYEIKDWVKGWAGTDEAQAFLPAENKGGSATDPASKATTRGGITYFDGKDPRNWSKYLKQVEEGTAQAR